MLCDITPPDADTLISLAPWRIWYRTQAITSGTPLAMPSATDSGMMPGRSRWNTVGSRCPPYGVTACPAGIDARADVPALIDRALQRDVEQVAAGLDHQPEVAHGGEAGVQRGARVDRPAQCAIGRIVLHAVHRRRQALGPTRAADEQVEFHVHQARQQRDVAEVDDRCRIRQWPIGIDRDDAVAVDDHDRRRAHLAGIDVGPARRPQDRRTGHGTGSDTQSRVDAPESGTRGCFQHSTGNDTMIIEYSRCIRFSTSSGRSSRGNLSQ